MSEGLPPGWGKRVVYMLGGEELNHPSLATIGAGSGSPLSPVHLHRILWVGPWAHQLMVASIGLRKSGVMGSEACP